MVRVVVAGLSLALFAAACSSSSTSDSNADPVAIESSTPVSTESPSDAGAAEDISLGTREAGFGPGSLVFVASEIVDRLEAMSDSDKKGTWFASPPYQYEPLPTECGYATPTALAGLAASRESISDGPFGDILGVEVRIFEDEATAAKEVAVLNGPDAAECDAAGLERASQQLDGPDGIPGVEFDPGDGMGQEIEVPFSGLPVTADGAAARSFRGEVSVGAEVRPLEHVEWIVASGRYVIHLFVESATGSATDVAIEAARLLLAEQLPRIETNSAFDDAVNVTRAAVVPTDALPSYYEELETLSLVTSLETDCLSSVEPLTIAAGPGWINITPGIGGSQVIQETLVFASPEDAADSFVVTVDAGHPCLAEVFELPEPMFTLVDGSSSSSTLGGHDVLFYELEYIQTLGGVDFEVEFAIAMARVEEFIFTMRFAGLAGDSPDLQELVVTAIERSRK